LGVPWRDVLIIDDLERVRAEELDAIEQTIECKLPADYRAIMTTFGVGTYCGFVYFWHPGEIPRQTQVYREIWARYSEFFWPQSDRILALDQALRSFVLAITIDGDEIIFCPPPRDSFYVLPRHDQVVYTMPQGLSDPLVWEGGAGAGVRIPALPYFESHRGRGHVELSTHRTDLTIDSVYDLIVPHLSHGQGSIPRDAGAHSMVALFKDERAIVSLVAGGGDDRRVRVRIDFNLTQTTAVDALISHLIALGFRELGRSQPAR
jgi:hypothetical protein